MSTRLPGVLLLRIVSKFSAKVICGKQRTRKSALRTQREVTLFISVSLRDLPNRNDSQQFQVKIRSRPDWFIKPQVCNFRIIRKCHSEREVRLVIVFTAQLSGGSLKLSSDNAWVRDYGPPSKSVCFVNSSDKDLGRGKLKQTLPGQCAGAFLISYKCGNRRLLWF